MLIRFVTTSSVAIALFVVLILKSSMITRTVYKLGFFLGIVVLLVPLLPMPGEPNMTWMEIEIGHGRFAYVSAYLLAFAQTLLPFVVLIEAGLSGYRGFSSNLRYLGLAIAVLGLAGLVASFLIPRLIQR